LCRADPGTQPHFYPKTPPVKNQPAPPLERRRVVVQGQQLKRLENCAQRVDCWLTMKRTLLTLAVTSLLATTGFAGPIHDAAKTGDLAGVQAELDKGVDEDDDSWAGMTPLHWAARVGHKEVAELLIATGADVNAKANDGWTPLHWAANWGHKETIELLIAEGADVNAMDESDGTTPLDWAGFDLMNLLRKHGGKTGKELKAEDK